MKKRQLVEWFESCPFDAYSEAALEAAYRALVESED